MLYRNSIASEYCQSRIYSPKTTKRPKESPATIYIIPLLESPKKLLRLIDDLEAEARKVNMLSASRQSLGTTATSQWNKSPGGDLVLT